MTYHKTVSDEAKNILDEIIAHENEPDYWKLRFEIVSPKDDTILRGCFRELNEAKLVKTKWADNYPYYNQVLKDGYLYEEHLRKEKQIMPTRYSSFETELHNLINRADSIKSPINAAPVGTNIEEYNQPSEDWLNDVEIFYNKYLKDHALGSRINTLLFHRRLDAFSKVASCLRSISQDKDYIDKMNGVNSVMVPAYQAKTMPEYDVFLSHANKDKEDFVDDLYKSLVKLDIPIFYDKESLEWGDNWKQRILDGVGKAEFAIIVISENFFDREWTEKELVEFLKRQNRNGQKLILPIVHNITNEDLRKKYPSVADIQAIDSKKYSCDEIALLFARQLIHRLKA